VPPSALIIGKNGGQIATVNTDGIVQLKPVAIAHDLGMVVELADGLAKEDQVIANPPDCIASVDQMRIAADPKG